MSSVCEILQTTAEEKMNILNQLGTTEEELAEKEEILRNWIIQNKCFPEEAAFHSNTLSVALLNSKMSLEKAKKSVEGYLTVKKLYEQHFQKLIPDDYFQKISKLASHIVMPKLLPDLCRLHISKITDQLGNAEEAFDYYIMVLMIAELRLHYDFFLSNETLVDMRDFNLKNLLKYTPSANIELVHILAALNLRVHRIHVIYASPLWEKVMFMVKSLLPEKLYNRIIVHQTLEDLHKFIPKEYLPSDYGGTQKSLEELKEMWVKEILAQETILKERRELRVKTIIKTHQNVLGDLGLGTDGSFRKLAID